MNFYSSTDAMEQQTTEQNEPVTQFIINLIFYRSLIRLFLVCLCLFFFFLVYYLSPHVAQLQTNRH